MRMAMADRLSAVLFFALGMALLIGGWTMDRLEIRQIHPASIPGLLPMILGVLLAVCAVLLLTSSYSKSPQGEELTFSGGSWSRLALTAVVCCIYALGLIGTFSYVLATFLFTFAFALIFSFPIGGERRAQVIAVGGALALALFVSFGSATMFRELFLVRLP